MLDDATAWRIMRIKIARETGWALETIDELSAQDIFDLQAIFEGEAKASG